MNTKTLEAKAGLVKTLVNAQKGRIVSLDFIKQNGELRTLYGKVVPLPSAYKSKAQKNCIALQLMSGTPDKEYRVINCKRVTSLRAEGNEVVFWGLR